MPRKKKEQTFHEYDKDRLIYYLGSLMRTHVDKLFDTILDERYLDQILRKYFEGLKIYEEDE